MVRYVHDSLSLIGDSPDSTLVHYMLLYSYMEEFSALGNKSIDLSSFSNLVCACATHHFHQHNTTHIFNNNNTKHKIIIVLLIDFAGNSAQKHKTAQNKTKNFCIRNPTHNQSGKFLVYDTLSV